jgi:hypothetical protein
MISRNADQKVTVLADQVPMHHEGVHISQLRMLECVRDRANGAKTKIMPEAHRARIALQHKIELHRAVAERARRL